MSREENVEMMRLQIKVIDADRMAAIVDEMVRGRRLDARSKLADARLDYGKPFDPDGMRQGAEMLARADYWLEGGRDDANRDTAVLSVEQAANAWKNAAYALAEKLAKTTPPEERQITEAIKVLEDQDELLAIGDDRNIGMAAAIQILYNHRNELRKAAMQAAVSPQRQKMTSGKTVRPIEEGDPFSTPGTYEPNDRRKE